jgi:hypothetical protein
MKSFLFFLFLFIGITLPSGVLSGQVASQPLRLLNKPAQQHHQTTQAAMQLRDIQGPVPLPERVPWLLYGGIVLALLIFSLGFFLFYKARSKPEAPAISPWDRALTDLKSAANLKTEQPLQFTEHASRVLREYVESRFGLKITRQTSTEFLQTLMDGKTGEPVSAWHDSLKTCFRLCDLAKFAHRIPDPEDLEAMEQSIISFIEQTRPTETGEEQ